MNPMNSVLENSVFIRLKKDFERIRTHHNAKGIALLSIGLGLLAASFYVMSRPGNRAILLDEKEVEYKPNRIFNTESAFNYESKFSQNGFKDSSRRVDADSILSTQIKEMQARLDHFEKKAAENGKAQSGTAVSADATINTQASHEEPTVGVPSASGATQTSTGVQSGASSASPSTVRIFRDTERKPSLGSDVINFPVKMKEELKKLGIMLPSGSYVKGKLMTGIEAPEGKTYPVLLQLDYAYILPNQKRFDLAGCFMIAKAQGDLSTERVQMQATKLSCVSRKGQMFERSINGFVADDKDNSFAVMGLVNSKQDRVATMAFLSSIVEGVSKAIQQAQTTQQVTPLGGSQSAVTGDQTKYMVAGGAANAASRVAEWYLKQAENLLPTINIGSGQDVWIVMQSSVELPEIYFKKLGGSDENTEKSAFSYISNLIE